MSSPNIVRRELTVEMENGLHIVPCSTIAKAVRGFGGSVRIIRGETVADATSVFDLLGLNAQKGTLLVLEASGDGAETLLEQLVDLFDKGFEVGR